MNDHKFEIQEINSEKDLLALREIWQQLQEPVTFSTLGSSFEICRIAWQTLSANESPIFGYNKQMLILLVSDFDKPVAIVPLVKVFRDRKVGPFSKHLTSIEFLGHALLARHFRFFYDIISKEPSKELTEAIMAWLYAKHKFDIIHLAYISEESPNFDFAQPELLYSLICSTVDINKWQSFQQYQENVYSQSLKQNIRTAFNRAAKLSLKIDRQAGPATGERLETILHIAGVKLDALSFVTEGYRSFLNLLSRDNQTEAVLLSINDEPIAYRFYVNFPQGKFEIDTNRNWKYKSLELGSLLIDKSIEYSFAQKLDIHCDGLFGGIHSERFATRLIKGFKYVRAGNTILGNTVNKAIRYFHEEEQPILQKAYPLQPPQ